MINFLQTTISSIKSTSQRTLALEWSRAAGSCEFPKLTDFQIPERGHDPKFMVVWRVAQCEVGRDYVALYQGSHIQAAFHNEWRGRSMKDVTPAPLKSAALAGADRCVDNQCGVYMIYRTTDAHGRYIYCERMLLPFGSKENGIRHIVASMEVISIDGDVSLSTALSQFTSAFEITFTGCFGPK